MLVLADQYHAPSVNWLFSDLINWINDAITASAGAKMSHCRSIVKSCGLYVYVWRVFVRNKMDAGNTLQMQNDHTKHYTLDECRYVVAYHNVLFMILTNKDIIVFSFVAHMN